MRPLEFWLGIPAAIIAAGELGRRGRRRYKRLRAQVEQFAHRIGAANDNARSIEALAGSVTQLVVVVLDRLQHLEDRDASLEDRVDDVAELLVELEADVQRIKKAS